MSLRSPSKPQLACAIALLSAPFGVGCGPQHPGKDAGTAHRVSEVSVRIDVPTGGAPSASVLAFRAQVTGLTPQDVLGVVDPLVGQAPETACELRDVSGAARALGAVGGRVELDAFSGLTVDVGNGSPALRPSPRVYPDLAGVVGGVIGEAGPVDLTAAPQTLTLFTGAAGEAPEASVAARRDLPPSPRLLVDGEPLGPQHKLNPTADLTLQVEGPPRTFVELRPFGATLALACRIDGGRVTVPAADLARLTESSGRAPVSVEAVWRDAQTTTLGGRPTHLSLEVRASAVLELRQ